MPKKKKIPVDDTLIIGFDSESTADDADPARNIILSYQFACRFKGREWSGIAYARAGARIVWPGEPEELIQRIPERSGFAHLLSIAIARGIKEKMLTRWPEKVVATAHWTRADLSAMADYAVIKRHFDAVQNTYVTLGSAYQARVNVGGHSRAFRVSLIDTRLLVPGSTKSLAALGDLYQFPKLNPGSRDVVKPDGSIERIPYIERMDLLLADDPHLYEGYAIRDAEISARHVHQVWIFANSDLSLSLSSPPVTVGSLAVNQPDPELVGQRRRHRRGARRTGQEN